MIQMPPLKSTVSDKMLKQIGALNGPACKDKFLYGDIMNHGSDELKEIVFLITGGEPPANYKKKESEAS